MYSTLRQTLQEVEKRQVSDDRKIVLQPLITYIQQKQNKKEACVLNFICTHNSRRSQLAQLWAHTIADLNGIPVVCLSGGVEVTAFNERAVSSIQRSGFFVTSTGGENPIYSVSHGEDKEPLKMFSKLFDDESNQFDSFAAIMVCSDADENCPFIPGTEARIPLRYEDPKVFDGTPLEAPKYDERSMQIAAEMMYVFSNVNL